MPGNGPDPAEPADGPGTCRDDDPRLQAQRHHRPVRRDERRDRGGPHPLPERAHWHGRPEVLQADRRIGPRGLAVHVILDNLSAHKTPRSPSGSRTETDGAGTCTSLRRPARGPTSSNAGSRSSPTGACAAGHSPASQSSKMQSSSGPATGTRTPRRSSGRQPQPTSSKRSSEAAQH